MYLYALYFPCGSSDFVGVIFQLLLFNTSPDVRYKCVSHFVHVPCSVVVIPMSLDDPRLNLHQLPAIKVSEGNRASFLFFFKSCVLTPSNIYRMLVHVFVFHFYHRFNSQCYYLS